MPNTITPAQSQTGAFISTTQSFDVADIYSTDVKSPEFKELIVRLYRYTSDLAKVINIADKGLYVKNEFVTGSVMFSNPNYNATTNVVAANRQLYRMTLDIPQLPSTASPKLTVPHNIPFNAAFTLLKIYGGGTLPCTTTPMTGDYIPLPYTSASSITNQLELHADNTNVYIITGGKDYSAYSAKVVLEYIKS